VHKIGIIGDLLQDSRFLPRAAKTSDPFHSKLHHEGFVKNELDDLGTSVKKIDNPLHPELGFTVKPEPAFHLVSTNEIIGPRQFQHVS